MKLKAIAGSVVLGLAFFLMIVFRQDFVLAASLLRQELTPGLAAAIIFLTLCHFGNEPLRWWSIVRAQRPDLTPGRLYHAITATSLITYGFPMHLGMPLRLVMARKLLGMDYAAGGALLLIDSFFLYGAWILAGASGVAVMLPEWGLGTPAGVAGIMITGAAALTLFARHDWRHWQRHPLLSAAIGRFSLGLQMLSAKAALGNTLLLAIDILIYGLRHTLILAALGVDCSLLQVTLVVAMSVFAGFASLMPLGLGGYDFSVIFLLTMIGVPREAALAVPVINRILMISSIAVLGCISAGQLGLSWQSIREMAGSGKTRPGKEGTP